MTADQLLKIVNLTKSAHEAALRLWRDQALAVQTLRDSSCGIISEAAFSEMDACTRHLEWAAKQTEAAQTEAYELFRLQAEKEMGEPRRATN